VYEAGLFIPCPIACVLILQKVVLPHFFCLRSGQIDLEKVGVTKFDGPEGPFAVEVISATEDYVKLMK
jgi:hypothetical protein